MCVKQLLNPVILLVTVLPGFKSAPQEVFGQGGIPDTSSFNEAVLGAHNEYRQMHHSQHIDLDPQLTEEAQNYAKELSIRGISLLRHSQGYKEKKYGENIYAICDRHVLPIDPVKNWYSKVCRYDFLAHGAKSKAMPVKEFTQVVWRGTAKLGVGRAASNLGKPCTYIVARYLPMHDSAVRRTNVDIGDFNKEICKDSRYVGFGARG